MDQLIPELATTLTKLLQKAKKQAKQRNDIFWLASWLYRWCPESILEEARNSLKGTDEIPGSLIAVAGQCFSKEEDFRLFFKRFSQEIRGPNRNPIKPIFWLRAYRNLARFRPKALRIECLSKEDQDAIMFYYLQTFEGCDLYSRNGALQQSVYLAPQLLKRRRYDRHFLDQDTNTYSRFDKILTKTSDSQNISHNQKTNAKVARAVLSKKATQSTIEKFISAEG